MREREKYFIGETFTRQSIQGEEQSLVVIGRKETAAEWKRTGWGMQRSCLEMGNVCGSLFCCCQSGSLCAPPGGLHGSATVPAHGTGTRKAP